MSNKFPKPFFVKSRGIWHVQIQGRQYNLGPDEPEAWKRYHEMMVRPPEVAVRSVFEASNVMLGCGGVLAPNPAIAFGVIGSCAVAIGSICQAIGELRGE